MSAEINRIKNLCSIPQISQKYSVNISYKAASNNTLQTDVYEKPKQHKGLKYILQTIVAVGILAGLDYWKCNGSHCKKIFSKVKGLGNKGTIVVPDEAPAKYLEKMSKKASKTADEIIAFYPDSKTIRFKNADGKMIFYDKAGNVEARFLNSRGTSSFNPEGLDYCVEFPESNIKLRYNTLNQHIGKGKEIHLNSIDSGTNRDELLNIRQIFNEKGEYIDTTKGATLNIGGKIYTLSDCTKSDVVGIYLKKDIGIHKFAKWNKKTDSVEILDGSLTEQDVRELIDNFSSKLKERITTIKQAHKKSIKLIREYTDTKSTLKEHSSKC